MIYPQPTLWLYYTCSNCWVACFFFLLDLNVVVVGYVRNKKELSDFIGQEDNRSTDTNQNVLQIYYCPLRPENPVAFAKLRQGTDSTALG